MGVVGAFKSVVQMWRNIVATIRAWCQSVYNHRVILGAITILCTVCRFFPSVLWFFISSSPLFICTAVLLNTLLNFGHPNKVQDEEQRTYETSLDAHKLNDFSLETRMRKRNEIRERALEKSGVANVGKALTSNEKKVAFSPMPYEGSMRRKVRIEEPPKEIPRACSSNVNLKDQSPEKETDDDSDDNETSVFGSDIAECSSPDTPPINVLPVIDEINPLLESKVPQLPLTSPDEFEAVLESSDRSLDGSVDSETETETENQEGTQGNKEDGAKPLVTWTEDDQKNLMDLGTSELERNQRLENLIAKRRARKNFIKVAEKNLIDFDSNDPPIQIPSISTVKSNPFDVPFYSSEIDGLPPIPGSAPSVLVPRGNPFDLPYDPQEEKPNLTEDSFQQEFMSVFCRHESFSLGPSFMAGHKQDKYNTKFTPYKGMSSEGFGYSSSSAQFGASRSSVQGSVPDSESLPPIDPRNRKKQMARVLSLGVYPPSYADQDRKRSHVNLMKHDHEIKRDADLNKFETKEVEKDLTMHDKTEILMEPEVVKESSFSSPSNTNEEAFDVKIDESQSNESKEPSSSLEESDHSGRVMEGVDDANTKEPVYDSSPSAVEKRTIDEYLVYPDKDSVLTTCSSIASDMQVEVSEAGSPRESFDRYTYADGESSFHHEIDKNAIDSRDNSVEEELRQIEETENEYNSVEAGGPVYDSVSEDCVVVVEHPGNNSNSASSHVNGTEDKDQTNDAPPSSVEPEMHVEVYQSHSAMESMADHPLSDWDKREVQTEETEVQSSSGSDHNDRSYQETSLKFSEEGNDVDNVNEPLFNDNNNIVSNESIKRSDNNLSHQEASLRSTEEPNTIDNLHEPLSNEKRDSENLVPSEDTDGNNSTLNDQNILENPQKEATTAEAEESSGVHKTTEVVINPSKPMQATRVEVETSRGHEMTNNKTEEEISEAIHVEDEAFKESQEEAGKHMEHKDEGQLHKQNEIESDKTEVRNQDQNS